GRLAKVRCIIGGVRSCKLPTLKLIVNRFLHNKILNYTIINNHAGKDYLLKNKFDEKKIIVIENGIRIQNQLLTRKKSNEIIILSVGRFDYTKDYITALRAME